MINKVVYFAYGSNMSSSRLRKPERAPSARVLGIAKLADWRFICNKKGDNGSAKANIEQSAGNVVWGVLYEINSAEISNLDTAEKGYKRTCLKVVDSQNNEIMAQTYISKKTSKSVKPHSWYKDFMVKGAYEHGLPPYYIEFLESIETKPGKD